MSSASGLPFGPSSDDEDDKSSDLQSKIARLKQEANSTAICKESATKEEEHSLGVENDEDEMARLRGSQNYARFEKSVGRKKRPRITNSIDQEAKVARVDHVLEIGTDIQGNAVPVQGVNIHDGACLVTEEHSSATTKPPSPEKASSKEKSTRSKSRLKIDPKILSDTDESENSESEGDTRNASNLPISNSVQIGKVSLKVTGISTGGDRLATSSADGTLKFFGLNTLSMYKEIEAINGGAALGGVRFSGSGGQLLVWGDSPSLLLMDREGKVLSKSPVGDRYVVDAACARGHSSALRGAVFMTEHYASISNDAAVRVWDAGRNAALMKQVRLIKLRSHHRGSPTRPQVMAVSSFLSDTLIVGCDDGALHMIDSRASRDWKKTLVLEGSSDFTCLEAEKNGAFVLSRSTDSKLRVFDLRHMEKAMRCFEDLPCGASETDAIFLGNDTPEYFATGSCRDGARAPRLSFFDRQTLSVVAEKDVTSNPTAMHWNESKKVMFYGTTDGCMNMMFDENTIDGEILACVDENMRHNVQF